MKKLIASLLLLSMILYSLSNLIMINQTRVYHKSDVDLSNYYLSLSDEIVTPTVYILDKSYSLFKTYADNEVALNAFYTDNEELFNKAQVKYSLDDISIENYESYYMAFKEIIKEFYANVEIDPRSEYAYMIVDFEIKLDQFNEIFENVKINDEIIEEINYVQASEDKKLLEDLTLKLESLLPHANNK